MALARGLVLALIVSGAACQPSSTASPSPAASSSPAAPPSAAASPSPLGSSSPPAGSSSPVVSPSVAASAAIIADPSLLDALPAAVEGLAQQADAERDADLITNPTVVALASGLASALYIDPAVGDFAYATVVRLRSGTIDEASYRAWRDSFDEGACSQAGGVVGHAEGDLGGHRTFIGSCAGGVRTYHAVTDGGLLVSVSSVGERRLGEQVIEGLRASP